MLLNNILFVFLTSWNTVIAHQLMILEEAYHCLPNSIILLNYTYTKATGSGSGYVKFVENIEANSNTLISIGLQQKKKENFLFFFKHNFNVTKSDFCVALNSDILFMPHIRQFIYMEKFCPVNKGVYPFQKYAIHFKNAPILPIGCWSIEISIERNNKIISCIQLSLQMLQSPKSRRLECH